MGRGGGEEAIDTTIGGVPLALLGGEGAVDGITSQQVAGVGIHDAVHPSFTQLRGHILCQRHTTVVSSVVPFVVRNRGTERDEIVFEHLTQSMRAIQGQIMIHVEIPTVPAIALERTFIGVAILQERRSVGVRGIVCVRIRSLHTTHITIDIFLVTHVIATHLIGGGQSARLFQLAPLTLPSRTVSVVQVVHVGIDIETRIIGETQTKQPAHVFRVKPSL